MKNDDTNEVIVVLCTVPSGSAHIIAKELIDRTLAACINILPIRSVYRWEGAICDEAEDLLIIKTTLDVADELTAALVCIHPYDVPEVLCLPVIGGYSGYLSWVTGEINELKNSP